MLKKQNAVTIKVSVKIGLGMVCKQFHNQKKWRCYLEEVFLFS